MIGFNYWKNTIAVEIQRLFAWIIWARYFLAIFNFLLLILGIVLIESNQSMSFTAESRENPQLFDGNETTKHNLFGDSQVEALNQSLHLWIVLTNMQGIMNTPSHEYI